MGGIITPSACCCDFGELKYRMRERVGIVNAGGRYFGAFRDEALGILVNSAGRPVAGFSFLRGKGFLAIICKC